MSNLLNSVHNLFRKGIFVFLANILEKIVFFLVFIFIARRFDPGIYGGVTAAFAFGNILASFFEFGFAFYFQRETAAGNQRLENLLRQAFSLRVAVFIPYLIIAFAYFFIIRDVSVFPALIIAVSVFILTTNNMLNAVFFGWNAYQKSFSMLLISRSFLIASFFVLYVLQADLLWMMSAFLLSALIHFVYLIQELKRNNLRIGLGRFSVSELKRILISSLPMGLGMIFVWIYDRVDVLILRGFTDDTMVAYFAIAYSLYKAPQAFANFILTPLFSDLSNEFSQKKFISSTTISQRFTHLLFFILPILLILMIISGWLPSFIYGSRYAVASPYFLYLLIALPGLLFNNFSGTTLNAARQELVVAKTVAAGAALNILLNVYLIPTYAVQGCVIATIITEYAVFLLQLYWIIKLKIIMRPEERRW